MSHQKKRKKQKADRRGVALVMVLGAITVLTVFLTELQEQTSSDLSAALSDRDAAKAEYYAKSGINLSRLLIALEPNIRKSVSFLGLLFPGGKIPQLPVWKYQDMLLGPFNDSSANESFSSLISADPSTGKNLGLTGGGRFELTIVDEDSKININTAALNNIQSRDILGSQLLGLMLSPEYNLLFEGRDADNQFSKREDVCGALIDWADSDPSSEQKYPCDPNSNTNSATGAEDNYYQNIGLPYRNKNAAFDSLDELRLIRRFDDDFWATFVDPDPSNPDKRIMTVWGQGKINMNSANAQTLLAVICADKGAAATFCADLAQVGAFLQIVSMARALLPPGIPLFGSPKDLVEFLKKGSEGAAGTAGAGGQPSPGAMIAQLLTSMTGVTLHKVDFQNANQNIIRQLGNTSKIFSIYADGIVPGYRKTTRVRIHSVVDFRLAQGIGEAFGVIPSAGNAGGTGAPPSGPNNAMPGAIPPAAYEAIMRADPGGTVIYWRVE